MTAASPACEFAARIEVTPVPGRFVLVGRSGGEDQVVEIEGRPSFASAIAWERTVRRVERVRFRWLDGRWHADIDVVNHRLPARRSVRVDTALALGLRGHPIVAGCERPVDGRVMEGVDDGRVSL